MLWVIYISESKSSNVRLGFFSLSLKVKTQLVWVIWLRTIPNSTSTTNKMYGWKNNRDGRVWARTRIWSDFSWTRQTRESRGFKTRLAKNGLDSQISTFFISKKTRFFVKRILRNTRTRTWHPQTRQDSNSQKVDSTQPYSYRTATKSTMITDGQGGGDGGGIPPCMRANLM